MGVRIWTLKQSANLKFNPIRNTTINCHSLNSKSMANRCEPITELVMTSDSSKHIPSVQSMQWTCTRFVSSWCQLNRLFCIQMKTIRTNGNYPKQLSTTNSHIKCDYAICAHSTRGKKKQKKQRKEIANSAGIDNAIRNFKWTNPMTSTGRRPIEFNIETDLWLTFLQISSIYAKNFRTLAGGSMVPYNV